VARQQRHAFLAQPAKQVDDPDLRDGIERAVGSSATTEPAAGQAIAISARWRIPRRAVRVAVGVLRGKADAPQQVARRRPGILRLADR